MVEKILWIEKVSLQKNVVQKGFDVKRCCIAVNQRGAKRKNLKTYHIRYQSLMIRVIQPLDYSQSFMT